MKTLVTNRVAHRWIAALGLPLLFTVAASDAQSAEEYLRFQVKVTPADASTDVHITHIPGLELQVTPALSVPADAAAQLSRAVKDAAAKLPNAAQFEPVTTPAEWKVAVKSDPRELNAALIAPFTNKLVECYHAIDPGHAVEQNALWLVLRGGASLESSVSQAKVAVQIMADAYTADGCATARNAKPVDATTRDYFTSGVRGVLTDVWDRRYVFGDRDILRVADVLSPLFFWTNGVWVKTRFAEVRSVMTDALAKGLPSEAQFEDLSTEQFATFIDFVTKTTRQQPGIVEPFFQTVAAVCIGDIADFLYEPFSLGDCLATGALTPVKFKLGNLSAVAIAKAVRR